MKRIISTSLVSGLAVALAATLIVAPPASAYTVIDYSGKTCYVQFFGYMSMNANLLGYRNHRWVVNDALSLIEMPYTSSWKNEYTQYFGISKSDYNSAYGSAGANSLAIHCR